MLAGPGVEAPDIRYARADSGIVMAGSSQYVFSNAEASDTVVFSGAFQYVPAGDTATDAALDCDASQIVYGSS